MRTPFSAARRRPSSVESLSPACSEPRTSVRKARLVLAPFNMIGTTAPHRERAFLSCNKEQSVQLAKVETKGCYTSCRFKMSEYHRKTAQRDDRHHAELGANRRHVHTEQTAIAGRETDLGHPRFPRETYVSYNTNTQASQTPIGYRLHRTLARRSEARCPFCEEWCYKLVDHVRSTR